MRLLLFDIDGTLIDAHRAGYHSLTRAMTEVFGTAGNPTGYDWRGKTDPLIVQDILRAAGIPEDAIREKLSRCFDVYVSLLESLLSDGHPVTILPGVPELVGRLSLEPTVLVGLLTGNVEGGAWTKLKPTGLSSHFRLAVFGSDDSDRRRLPALARRRAQELAGIEIPWRDVLVIGDTPLDVDCARANGAVAVAVATGQHSVEELAAVKPDLLFSNFADVESSVRALLSYPPLP
jgi:phosphoglycolate phosphatase